MSSNTEKAKTAGACGGFLAGAAVGAKIGTSLSWLLIPFAPVVIAGGALVGGAIGALGGASLGECIVESESK